MKTTDFNKPITSSKLKENLDKQFGANVNIDQYSREQLEDIRNKLRTRIFQQEGSSKMADLLTNETYQKDQAMLQLLNTRIKEMLGEDIKKLRDKMDELSEATKGVKAPKYTKKAAGSKPDFIDIDDDGNKKEKMKDAASDKKTGPQKGVNPFAKKDTKVKEGKHPSDCDCQECSTMEGKGDGNLANNAKPYDKVTRGDVIAGRLGKDAKGGKDKKMKEATTTKTDKPWTDKSGKTHSGTAVKGKGYDGSAAEKEAKAKDKKPMKESQFKHNVRFVNESLEFLLAEDEEGKAKAITAAGDMVNDYTSWMQRVGQYQTKTMIELADAIKADFGAAEAEAFKAAVGPALSQTLEVLTQQREAVSNAVAALAGEATPEEPMGMEPGMDQGMDMPPEPGMDMSEPDAMNSTDEFGASDAAAGGAETAGRAMRESRQERIARKLAESHSIMAKLSR